MTTDISRRSLICNAAGAGAALVAAGTLAGSALADVDANIAATDGDLVRGTDAPETWDFEADIVVLGAGGSGLPAGLRALEEGLSVLFVDANYDIGGRAALSGGNLHSGCGTEIQKKYGIEDSPDKYYEDHTTFLTGQSMHNDRDYVRAVADSMVEAYEWIQDQGVIVKDVEPIKQPDYTEGGTQPETVARWTYTDQETEELGLLRRLSLALAGRRPARPLRHRPHAPARALGPRRRRPVPAQLPHGQDFPRG